MPAGAILKEEGAVPPMPLGAYVKDEEGAPPMPSGPFLKEEVVVPPVPPDAFVKQEHEVVVKEEERSDDRRKRCRNKVSPLMPRFRTLWVGTELLLIIQLLRGLWVAALLL